MKIRIATSGDVADMFRIRIGVHENKMTMAELAEYGITPESLPTMLSGDGQGWVAEQDGKVVAFAMADAGDATIFALFVAPPFEGQGIGRGLMAAAEQWLRGRGCTQAWLETDSDSNVRANGFYRHLGWLASNKQEDGQTKFIKHL
ncbi:TPA: GNAT family N-acetyltransferase [Serratia odorifera]|jgi:GNAT superfamily N-acetyltransferase